MQLHPHSGSGPAALLHGGRGDPDSAADGPGKPAGGLGEAPQPAGPEDGPHRRYRAGKEVLLPHCGSAANEVMPSGILQILVCCFLEKCFVPT